MIFVYPKGMREREKSLVMPFSHPQRERFLVSHRNQKITSQDWAILQISVNQGEALLLVGVTYVTSALILIFS